MNLTESHDFFSKYLEVVSSKQSCLNINLDPALPTRRETFIIPDRFKSSSDERSILDFCLEIVEQVSEYCCSIKPNTQYFLGAYNILPKLVKKIHDEGMLAILDHKLSDIGSTNESAIFWIASMGFDAFTYSPFPGNIRDTVEKSHQRGLGVLVLTLMSNPEAEELLIDTTLHRQPYYLNIANSAANAEADGCVVGLTGFIRDKYVKNIQEILSDNMIVLMQGIGPQGGDIAKASLIKNPLISLGREVIYSANPKQMVKEYQEKLERLQISNFHLR